MAIGAPIQRQQLELITILGTRNMAIASNVTAGTKMILMVTSNVAKVVSSLIDSQGHSWTVSVTASDGTRTVSFCEADCVTTMVAGVDTITVTFSNATSGQVNFWLHEVSGLATGVSFDKSASGTGTGTALATGATGALAQADEYVQAGFRTTGAGTGWTKGASYTDPTTPQGTTNGIGSACEYQIVSANTSLTADGTWSTSGSWVGLVATYLGAGAAPPAAAAPRQAGAWTTRSG